MTEVHKDVSFKHEFWFACFVPLIYGILSTVSAGCVWVLDSFQPTASLQYFGVKVEILKSLTVFFKKNKKLRKVDDLGYTTS